MFGIEAIKGVSIIMTCVVIVLGVTLIARGVTFYKTWTLLSDVLGQGYDVPCVVAISLGTITIVVGGFGLMSICLNGYGMLVLYCVLLALISLAMIIYGLVLWMDIKSEQAERMIRLSASINSLPPEMLTVLEVQFKCCGVEKYTDYDVSKANKTKFVNFNPITPVMSQRKGPKPIGAFKTREVMPFRKKQKVEKPEKGSFKKILREIQMDSIEEEKEEVKVDKVTNVWRLEETLDFKDVTTEVYFDLQKNAMLLTKPTTVPTYLKGIPDWLTNLIPQHIPEMNGKPVINWVVNWKDRLLYKVGRWILGSAWGKNEEGLILLPTSCCKNLSPHVKCYGDPYDTWQEGCRNKLLWYWKGSYLELALLFMCFVIPLVTTMMLVYVLKSAVRQKYYL